jgi:hypothetical protein
VSSLNIPNGLNADMNVRCLRPFIDHSMFFRVSGHRGDNDGVARIPAVLMRKKNEKIFDDNESIKDKKSFEYGRSYEHGAGFEDNEGYDDCISLHHVMQEGGGNAVLIFFCPY